MVPKIIRCRPNYFLGFRVDNPLIHRKSKEIQELVVNEHAVFKKALTNLTNLHVTLNVFHLPAEEDVNKVSKLLDQWATERVKEVFQDPIHITIRGIKYFSGGVIFANVEPCENYFRLCSLADELNGLLVDAGYVGDKKKFSPHLTLLKLSKHSSLYKYKQEFKAVSEELVKTLPDFGIQNVQTIQLLSMTKKASDGYYFCAYEILTSGSKCLLEGNTSPELSNRRSFHTSATPCHSTLPASTLAETDPTAPPSSLDLTSDPTCTLGSDSPAQSSSGKLSSDSPSSLDL